MNRRNFIKTSAIAGGSLGVTSAAISCNADQTGQRVVYHQGDLPEREKISSLENAFLRVDIHNDASLQILDKVNRFEWNTGPVAIQEFGTMETGHVWLRQDRSMCEQYPGRFMGVKKEEIIEFLLLGRQNRQFGKFTCRFSLDKEWFKVSIENIEEGIPSLVFPPPVQCDALILPRGIGKLMDTRETGPIFSRYLHTFYSHLNMKFAGGQKEGYAWMVIFEDGFEDAGAMVANGCLSPACIRSLGRWKHPFHFKYRFIKGNYVDIAKIYREDFKQKGLFLSLEEKIKLNPELEKFRGGRAFWINLAMPGYRQNFREDFLLNDEQIRRRSNDEINIYLTYKELSEFIEKLKAGSLKSGFLKIAGWINGGYDASHPDVWPPEPQLGPVEELKQILSMDESFALGIHDNYQDIYETMPSFPKGVNQLADGTLQTGGAWAGGQAYILNSQASIDYARRNWELLKTLSPRALFVDTITATQLFETYEPGSEKTKADDNRLKMALMAFFKEKGLLFGSEEVADFGIPYVDWFETRHTRVQGETIPLWPLVFHDAAYLMSYGSGMSGKDMLDGLNPPLWLEAMQWGYMPHYFHRRDFDFKAFNSLFQVDEWHAKIALAEMTHHEFLNPEKTLEKTQFSNGAAIICNYGIEPVVTGGKTVEKFSCSIQ